MTDYDPFNWFWIVGGDQSKAWSSAAGAYVTEWPSDRLTRILNESELNDVLSRYGLRGPLVTIDDVLSERTRRLALGFDYDFGDARGVHRIGTTDADMKGWDEVSKGAQAAINLGGGASEIAIETDTGPVTLTALEFQQVLVAATAYRQPIWLASFAIQKMTPIPADYADDSRWV